MEIRNSYADVVLAYPLFIFGNYLRRYREILNSTRLNTLLGAFILSLPIIYICGRYNDIVMMYKCSYGSSITLFLLGGCAGTLLVYSISIVLSKMLNSLNVSIIGGGTMVILGIHPILIVIMNNIVNVHGLMLYVFSLALLLIFIPINQYVKKHFPVLYGTYR